VVPRLSRAGTVIAALILLPALLLIAAPPSTESRLGRLVNPERALPLVVGLAMDVREGAARVPGWQRTVFRTLGLQSDADLALAIAWYDELVDHMVSPGSELELAILEAEDGQLDAVQERVEDWEQRGDPFSGFAAVIGTAYLGWHERFAGIAQVEPWLGHAWYRDRLSIALARARQDARAAEGAEQRLAARSGHVLGWVRSLVAATLGVIVLGVVCAIAVVRRARRAPGLNMAGTAVLPPPWPASDGLGVLLRGGALSGVVLVAMMLGVGLLAPRRSYEPWWLIVVEMAIGLAMLLPALVLAERYLFSPAGLPLRDAVGLRVAPGGGIRILMMIAIVLAAVAVGDLVVGIVAEAFGATGHWTEWFDDDLVFGSPLEASTTAVAAIVVAPISEEILFRGLLYATLRRRLAWSIAALISALAFAAVHGYTVHGFVSVAWSGFVWAWAYERTRSLWPAIIGHAAANATATILLAGLLRP
jgi:membrane protease YdiL (CAAX protease family)